MPGPCTVCSHPKMREIEAMLGQGLSGNEVAIRYGLNRNAVYRHWRLHASKRIQAKREAKAERATVAAISSREARIAAKDERWRRLQAAVVSAEDADLPKMVPVAAEVRQIEESAAKDLGQWIPEGADTRAAGGQQVIIVLPDLAGAPIQHIEAEPVPVIDLVPRRDLPGVYQPVAQLPAPDPEPDK